MSDVSFLPAHVRDDFPGAHDKIYLNNAVNALLPTCVAEAAHRHIDERWKGTGDKAVFQEEVERSRRLMAELIGADHEEVAVTKNVSEALNLFAASLPWQDGDNVVLCAELEHPNNVFLWYNLRKRFAVDVRAVPPRNGYVPVEDMAAAMDDRTRVVTIPSITFSPGFVTETAAITAAAHERGALVLLDAAQSIGALRTDVAQLGVDALAVATQKSVLSLYGVGFLYVRKTLADSLHPIHVARYGMDLGTDAGETARSDGDAMPYAAGARRFDLGNYNYLGHRAAAAALQYIHDLGPDRIEQHVRALAHRLANGLLDLGLTVAGGRPGPHLAHIVAVGETGGGDHDSADDPRMNSLYEHMTAHGIHLSIRKGILRMALGVYNNVDDVDRTLAIVADWVNGQRTSA